MRKTALMFVAVTAAFVMKTDVFGQILTTDLVPYATPNRGGTTIETVGGTGALVVGYGRVQPASSTSPASVAILGLRQNGVLVSEAGVPGVTTLTVGRTFAEVNGPVNTGIAIANPNPAPVIISFFFTDQFGNDFPQFSFTLNANAQMSRFLSEAPFSARNFAGSVTFNATAPIAMIAVRSLTNERSETLVTTQTVTSIPQNFSAGTLVMGHFADGGGWRTQVILVNTTDTTITGTVQFFGDGTDTTPATPLTITVNGQVSASFDYTVRARSSINLQTAGLTFIATQVGSVRVTPTGVSTSPSAFTIFSFVKNGVTVSQTTVQTQQTGRTFRTYVEVNSRAALPGSIQSAIAIANNSSTAATITLELTTLDGASTGLTAILTVPPQGHLAKFVHELFPTLPIKDSDGNPLAFNGILRLVSSNTISVVSLRTRYNERGDFLITTLPASNEADPSSSAEVFFPHLVDRGGFTTQFVLFSGLAGQNSTGTLRFVGQDGQALILTIREPD